MKETVVSANSFDARSTLQVGDESYEIFRLDKVEGSARLPYSLKVLLENLLPPRTARTSPPTTSAPSGAGTRRPSRRRRSSSRRPA
jgi:aconitase A